MNEYFGNKWSNHVTGFVKFTAETSHLTQIKKNTAPDSANTKKRCVVDRVNKFKPQFVHCSQSLVPRPTTVNTILAKRQIPTTTKYFTL